MNSFKRKKQIELIHTVLFVHSMLSARCFSLNRLVAVTLPQVEINDKKKKSIIMMKTYNLQ
jgi:hypothetical protein